MIAEYQLQKYRRKRSGCYFEVYFAKEAEENYENARHVVSLGRDLKAGPSEQERVGVTVRPCKNENPNQKDRFISRKHGKSLTCKRYISSDQLSNIDKRRKSVACVFAGILKETIMHGHDCHNTTILSIVHNMSTTCFGQYYFWPSSGWIQLSEKTNLLT